MKSKLVYVAVVFCMIFALLPAVMPASSIQALVPPTHHTWHVNGATANFTGIQQAIDSDLVLPGDTIIVYDGTYTENIIVWKALTLKTDDGDAIIDGGGGNAVTINVSNVIFGAEGQGFNIINASDGIHVSSTTGNVTGVSIINNNISGCTSDGIYVTSTTGNVTGVSIIDNNISGCTSDGIYFDPPMPNESVYGNTISDNEISGCPVGIDLDNENSGDFYNNTITGNTVYDCSNMGIDVYNDGVGNISSNNISVNTIYDCSYAGIEIENSYNGSISGNTVTGNTLYNCSSYGIYLYNDENIGNMLLNNVSGNTIYDSGTGIDLDSEGSGNMSGNIVTGNTIHDGDYGVYLYNYAEGDTLSNNISGNTIYDMGTGIYLNSEDFGNMSGNIIDGNTINGNSSGEYGIYLYNDATGSTDGNTIQANNVSNCYASGIYLEMEGSAGMDGNTILNNNVSDCDEGYDAGIYIGLESSSENSSMCRNTIEGNTVVNSSQTGILLFSNSYGNMSENTISGNTLYNDFGYGYGSGVVLHTYNYGSIENSSIESNTVYGFEYGIYLEDVSDYSIDNINISNNRLWNGLLEAGIGNNYSISVDSAHDISIAGNDISYSTDAGVDIEDSAYNISITANDIHHNYGDGILTDDANYINISSNTIHHNGYYKGSGIDVEDSNYINVWSNDIHANPEGIYIYNSDEINIYSNDIRNNIGNEFTGIYVDYGSEDVYIYCNNIVSNDEGVYSESEYNVEAYDNWWGAADGPSYDGDGHGDSVYADGNGYLYYEPWLTTELNLGNISSEIINTASIPGTISLYDAIFNYEKFLALETPGPSINEPGYTLGPSCTDLILELNTSAYSPTSNNETSECTPTATVNLSALLLDMLPADFQQAYVSQWDTSLQEDWQIWMNDLSQQEMNPETYYMENGTYYYDYELCLYDLIFNGGKQVCGYSCYSSLEDFFYEAYNNGDAKFYDLLLSELRLGNFEVPATITSCGDENGTVTTIPLTIVDFQLPMAAGWNLRSTPITLDSSYSTWGAIKSLGDGMPGLEAAVTYNASAGRWEELTNASTITPLSAYFIKMSGNDQLGFIVSRNVSMPPSRQLYRGWNLVSAATSWSAVNQSADLPYVEPFPLMLVQDALVSAQVAGNISGWTIAIGMPDFTQYLQSFYYKGFALEMMPYEHYFAQMPWTAIYSGNWSGDPYEYTGVLTPGGGYWVYMEHPDTLAGFSFTPLFWDYKR